MNPAEIRAYKLWPSLSECQQHCARLHAALSEAAHFPQLLADSPQPLSDEQVRTLDQLLFRFGKLQDALATRVLPAMLQTLGEWEDAEPFLDKLNRAERLGLISSAEQWLELRELRNQAAHEYPDQPEIAWANLKRFIARTPELLGISAAFQQNAERRFGSSKFNK